MMKKETEARSRMGRPPIPAEQRTVNGSIRLTPDRWAKLRELGTGWLNKAIDRAKVPEA